MLAGLDPAAAAGAARGIYEGDPDDHVRASALGYLARSGNPELLPLVETAAEPGHSGWLRQAALNGLAHFRVPEAAVALERLTAPREPRGIRVAALEHLPTQGDTARAVALATRSLDDPDPLFAAGAVAVLARIGGARARALLLQRYATERRVRVLSAITEVLHP